jgi:hypothetical protein
VDYYRSLVVRSEGFQIEVEEDAEDEESSSGEEKGESMKGLEKENQRENSVSRP